MKGVMISCKKAGELIEKKKHEELSLAESLQLQAHKAMCSACRLYEKQSGLIDQLFKSEQESDPFDDDEITRIKDKIKNQGKA